MTFNDSKNMKKQVIVVVVGAIRFGNKYLLTKRVHKDKLWHDRWQLPGGQLEHSEEISHCLKRELKEEVNIPIKDSMFIPMVYENIRYGSNNSHIILVPFLCKVKTNNFKIKLDKEASAFNWYTMPQIKKLKTLNGTAEIVENAEKL